MLLFCAVRPVADKLSTTGAPTAKFRRRDPAQTAPRRQLPDSDASVFALQGPQRTTGFRRHQNWIRNPGFDGQKWSQNEASKTGSWRGEKNHHEKHETHEAAASESGSWKIRLCNVQTWPQLLLKRGVGSRTHSQAPTARNHSSLGQRPREMSRKNLECGDNHRAAPLFRGTRQSGVARHTVCRTQSKMWPHRKTWRCENKLSPCPNKW